MAETGIVRNLKFLDHRPGAFHPESHKRLEAIYSMLDESDMVGLFEEIPARPAQREELLFIHAPEYVDAIAATDGKEYQSLDPDTSTSADSYRAALLAAGGVCEAIAHVLKGRVRNAFALVRPPGHHAERSRAMGFCLFNNVAVAARYAQEAHGLGKILVVDWDLHHGNGSQHAFEDDSSILYFSTHQYPYYPGSGAANQAGTGEGEGFTVNVPLSTGHGDGEYAAIFERVLKPVGTAFNPDLILVSAGFDIHKNDPLGGMNLTAEGFAAMTRCIMELADACCGGKVVMTLEGGYDLKGLQSSVKAVLMEMAGLSRTSPGEVASHCDEKKIEGVLKSVFKVQGRFWESLRT